MHEPTQPAPGEEIVHLKQTRDAGPGSQRGKVLLRWLGTIILGYYIVSRANIGETAASILAVDPGWIAAAIGLYAVDRLTAAFKWRILLTAGGIKAGLTRVLSALLRSTFLGSALPATVGVDIIRARMICRDPEDFQSSLASVIVERIAGMASLLLAAALGISLFAPGHSWRVALPLLGVSVLIIALVSAFVIAPATGLRARAGSGLWTRGLQWIEALRAGLRSYYSKRRLLLAVSLIALSQHYLLTLLNWFLALSLGTDVSLLAMLWVWPIVMLAVRLPISVLGFGVREAVLLQLLGSIGVPPESAVSLGFLSGALDLAFTASGGLLVLSGRLQGRLPEPEVMTPVKPAAKGE